MARKKRKVEVLAPHLTFLSEDSSSTPSVTFSNLLDLIDGKEIPYSDKEFEFKLLSTTLSDCKVGIIETMQSKDLPPKKNRETKELSSLPIDPTRERLVFANIFLYDTRRNVLLYEVNKNGCYPDKLRDGIYHLWNNEYESKLGLNFTPILRRNSYEKMMRMGYYKKIRAKICNPVEVLRNHNEITDSIENNVKLQLESAIQTNADCITIEQVALTKKLNPMGLNRHKIIDIADSIRIIASGCVEELTVQGYFTDPEGPKGLRNISLLADTFDSCFYLDEVQLQSDVQTLQRKAKIEELYTSLLPELRSILEE